MTTGARLWSVLLLFVLVGAACSSGDDTAGNSGSTGTSTGRSGVSAERLSTAIERTAGYFETRPPRGDAGFLIGQGSQHLSPAFERWSATMQPDPQVTAAAKDRSALNYLEAIMWQGRDQPLRSWQDMERPTVPPVSSPTTLDDRELNGITQVMSMGLRCKELTGVGRTRWLDALATPSHSYLLTHQLLSLVWGRNNGCLDDAEANPLRTKLATAVFAELLADGTKVNDLSLERMAMLCYADLCNWVTDEQTTAVVRDQHRDGSWGDASVPINQNASVPPAHTAGLGFYVLAMRHEPGTTVPSPPR